ncbi:WxL domain-containing protein [Enterococcus quebecensis]|uniref:WxL domain-containing protein n=1 Tax=Enterococcus quebecensis TaxID=903983 RepID=A0A1E5GX42_9ENTE|nr:WxL domain-containing protein [Enterococcus quebecensis]OEG17237.1 hypothetical protein BCR23_04335 [Enterococcus quebecensis]OJG75633.1 hypothetical protein RV12_GL001436 [Enterococcus quebecensis]
MKKFTGVTLLSGLLLSAFGFSSQALAVDKDTKATNATVTYTQGDMTIDPGDGTIGSGLPANLNFGSHKIQNKAAEKWTATEGGVENGTITTGKLNINDERGNKAGWSVKVAQTDQFKEKEGTAVLENAALTITTGAVTNIGGTAPTGGQINGSFTLAPGVGGEQLVFGAKATTGDGISTLALTKFELAVPAATAKKAVEYQSSLTWTLSDTPAP